MFAVFLSGLLLIVARTLRIQAFISVFMMRARSDLVLAHMLPIWGTIDHIAISSIFIFTTLTANVTHMHVLHWHLLPIIPSSISHPSISPSRHYPSVKPAPSHARGVSWLCVALYSRVLLHGSCEPRSLT